MFAVQHWTTVARQFPILMYFKTCIFPYPTLGKSVQTKNGEDGLKVFINLTGSKVKASHEIN